MSRFNWVILAPMSLYLGLCVALPAEQNEKMPLLQSAMAQDSSDSNTQISAGSSSKGKSSSGTQKSSGMGNMSSPSSGTGTGSTTDRGNYGTGSTGGSYGGSAGRVNTFGSTPGSTTSPGNDTMTQPSNPAWQNQYWSTPGMNNPANQPGTGGMGGNQPRNTSPPYIPPSPSSPMTPPSSLPGSPATAPSPSGSSTLR